MIEVLPIRLLQDADAPIFGSLNVSLAKLSRSGLPVAPAVVVTPPNLHLKTVMEHFDFGHREIFEQSLTLVKKEIEQIKVPETLTKEVGKHDKFLLNGQLIKGIKKLWQALLFAWIEQIKERLLRDGFYQGITEQLTPAVVTLVNHPKAEGSAYFDGSLAEGIVVVRSGQLQPVTLKKIDEWTELANKRLFIPHRYEWVWDGGVKLTKILPYTPVYPTSYFKAGVESKTEGKLEKTRSVVKVYQDLSSGFPIENEVDGVFIASEKLFNLNKPNDSFEQLVLKLVESAAAFPQSPVLLKLADISEGMGKLRGALRLIHQKSLFDPLVEALLFARNKHNGGHKNIHVVIPFLRSTFELAQIKRDLAVKKLMRKNSLQLWMEVATPENIINLGDYLLMGVDGVVLNLDELLSHLLGFDHTIEEMSPYKREVKSLLSFLEDSLKILHQSNTPFIAYGSIVLYPEVLSFLVEKGVYGVVVERYEAHSIEDLLHQTERRMILRKTA